MRIKGIVREEKRFKDQYKMRYHGVLGLSKGERVLKARLKAKGAAK